jgi:uncharacterized protein (UPF0276 family)
VRFKARDWFVSGGAMGWTPDQVRALSLSDFAAALEGWSLAQGGKPPLKEDDVAMLDDLMARYPDKQVH